MDIQKIIAATFVAQGEHHEEVDSTNDLARRYAEEFLRGPPAEGGRLPDAPGGGKTTALRLPLLIVADRQTAGRGRGSNRWWTGEGSLAFTLLLPAARRIDADRERTPLIGLAAAVAVAEASAPLVPENDLTRPGPERIERSAKTVEFSSEASPQTIFRRENLTQMQQLSAAKKSKFSTKFGANRANAPNRVSIHWPNDVFVAGRKLAGILVEVLADRRPIIGIGINTNNSTRDAPAELRTRAVTLHDLSGQTFDHADLLIDILQRFEKKLETLAESPHRVAREAHRLCGQKGRMLSVQAGPQTLTGLCLGISDDGRLRLETPHGEQTFHSGIPHYP